MQQEHFGWFGEGAAITPKVMMTALPVITAAGSRLSLLETDRGREVLRALACELEQSGAGSALHSFFQRMSREDFGTFERAYRVLEQARAGNGSFSAEAHARTVYDLLLGAGQIKDEPSVDLMRSLVRALDQTVTLLDLVILLERADSLVTVTDAEDFEKAVEAVVVKLAGLAADTLRLSTTAPLKKSLNRLATDLRGWAVRHSPPA